MRKLETILKTGGLALILSMTTIVTRGQPVAIDDLNFYIQLDEKGNGGVIGAASVLGSDPFLLGVTTSAVDPVSGMSTLRYTTPNGFAIASGDIVLCDPGGPIGPGGIFSDVIRIRGTLQNASIYFFSADTSGGDPADVGLPPTLQANVVYLPETPVPGGTGTPPPFLGGAAGALWEPAVGQVGDIPYADQNAFTYGYNIISVVPEPSSLALLGLAGVAALLRKRR